ncbi:MAG: ActS/PrrB/RegB family redox-sensitive histidine kinase [Oceanicaulis sp.]|uniref:ActS/PrrB/RegB family redox-sensitive histidine kinase n=1 Tax=Glycocaulis sp. TaxID=1969725 RepID=UPI0025BD92E0|nr:ActS/PrrB/RegB family redox-sensitive histidine kinase [Glycocaulis sp.]MCC5981887.1 ActS/PrrB/RegB family redox-sensitive histidine kinase [Oceanicaulis sp.]MCH8522803.1 ActS/PrrB/RegB family redox-sensitive histidine kinase [Glycocaulis sp.]
MAFFEAEADETRTDPSLTPLFGRVRLRTLIVLRWLAVTGQTITVLGVHYVLGFDLPVLLCLGVIAASVALNLVIAFTQPTQRFASDKETFAQLAYDVLQVMALVALTGGTANPFAFVVAAPVLIGVASLPVRWWITLAGLTLAGSLLIANWHMPLPWSERAGDLALPVLYRAGLWVALAITIAFTAVYAWRVGNEARRMATALAATQSVLAREQRLSALGALSAAAAHELGTPLATIQLTAKEMARAVKDPELQEDAALLVSQAQRCREILKRLSQQPSDTDRMHDRIALGDALEEVAAPLQGLGIQIAVRLEGGEGEVPVVRRRPEVLHALGNFIENAVDFADTRVEVSARWDRQAIHIVVGDDGAGFSPEILAKLGEPYITSRKGRTGLGGLGLGVFIAKTLIERVGGEVHFDNAPAPGGARVSLSLPRTRVDVRDEDGAR